MKSSIQGFPDNITPLGIGKSVIQTDCHINLSYKAIVILSGEPCTRDHNAHQLAMIFKVTLKGHCSIMSWQHQSGHSFTEDRSGTVPLVDVTIEKIKF